MDNKICILYSKVSRGWAGETWTHLHHVPLDLTLTLALRILCSDFSAVTLVIFQKWITPQWEFGADFACGVLFFRKGSSRSLRCDVSFIVKTLPGTWERAAPPVQVTFSGRGAAQYSWNLSNLSRLHDFPLSWPGFFSLYICEPNGFREQTSLHRNTRWDSGEPRMNAPCCRSWQQNAPGSGGLLSSPQGHRYRLFWKGGLWLSFATRIVFLLLHVAVPWPELALVMRWPDVFWKWRAMSVSEFSLGFCWSQFPVWWRNPLSFKRAHCPDDSQGPFLPSGSSVSSYFSRRYVQASCIFSCLEMLRWEIFFLIL